MILYQTTGVVAFAPGETLTLTAAQIARRAGRIRPAADGRAEVVQPVEFKAGEVIGLDRPLSRIEEGLMRAIEEHPAPAAPKGKGGR